MLAALMVCAVVTAANAGGRQDRDDRRRRERLDEANRREAAALVAAVDAAASGHAVSDFPIAWRNDFFKAQSGTFVPFTVLVERGRISTPGVLMYVRAVRRDPGAAPASRSAATRYPFELIFPVELTAEAGPIRITRGFPVPAGDYDVYVALRERRPDPLGPEPRLKAAVLRQPLSVPDFWAGELATSTVMLADRIEPLLEPPSVDDILERPYVIGDSEIHPAAVSSFRKDRELIVVFLIYNPTVSADRNFDVQVDYDLFRTVSKAAVAEPTPAPEPAGEHSAARPGERYMTHTTPQRFKPALMGAHFDPEAGHPMLAGQGILLSSFEEGEYRIGITVTDLLSRRILSRDVTFTVVGS
ncbi:MAG: hypothetical protein V7647_580 [Acidobacteriota bacterium]